MSHYSPGRGRPSQHHQTFNIDNPPTRGRSSRPSTPNTMIDRDDVSGRFGNRPHTPTTSNSSRPSSPGFFSSRPSSPAFFSSSRQNNESGTKATISLTSSLLKPLRIRDAPQPNQEEVRTARHAEKRAARREREREREHSPSRSRSRAGSSSSSSSSSSRRGSFREFFRRGSQELAHAKDIIVATKQEREKWMEEERARVIQTERDLKAFAERYEAQKKKKRNNPEANKAREAARPVVVPTPKGGLSTELGQHLFPHEQPGLPSPCRDSSESSSPARTRDINEESYIKIARSHKMRRVRQTIYCDPGNPFELEALDDDMLTRSRGASSALTESSGFNPALRRSGLNSSSPAARSDSSGFNFELEDTTEQSPVSPTFSEADSVLHRRGSPDVGMERFSSKVDLPLHAPKARRPGTPALVRAHSMKEALMVAAPFTSPLPDDDDDVYIPPRSLWRRSLPSNNLVEATGHVNDVVRDTKFYGFYDGVLDEYRADMESQI